VAFEAQRFSDEDAKLFELPLHEKDERLDYVVSEARVYSAV